MNEMEEFFVNVKLPRTDQSLKMKVCPEIQKMEAQLRESLRQLFNDMEPGDEVYIDFELDLQDKRGDSQVSVSQEQPQTAACVPVHLKSSLSSKKTKRSTNKKH